MGKNVLIIGQIPDPHIEKVASFVKQEGGVPVIFDCYQKDHLLQLQIDMRGPCGYVRIGKRSYALDSFITAWWRWKPTVAGEWSGAFSKVTEEFVSREWRATLRSLFSYMPYARWVNPVNEHFHIAKKPFQLALAASLGFRVPATLFTNDPTGVVKQFSKYKRLIYKTISSFIIPPDEMIYTTEITKEDVINSFPNIRHTPGTYQELIEKEYELRVTVVGNKVFAVKIHSQSSDETRIDWRKNQYKDMYETVLLDENIREQLLLFQEKAGIIYGAYDLIIPKKGSPVFLECNPGGQWMWLELNLGLHISRAIADMLMLGNENSSSPTTKHNQT